MLELWVPWLTSRVDTSKRDFLKSMMPYVIRLVASTLIVSVYVSVSYMTDYRM